MRQRPSSWSVMARIRAGAVPLFRTGTHGLEQAIRLRIDSADEPTEVTVSHRDVTLDRATVEASQSAQSLHLFVPEVESETRFRLDAVKGAERSSAEIIVAPQRKWSIHLIHHSHFDYGYTDPQAVVMEHQLRYLDAALDLIRATDDWDDDAAFRWNVEVTYPLQQWLRTRPARGATNSSSGSRRGGSRSTPSPSACIPRSIRSMSWPGDCDSRTSCASNMASILSRRSSLTFRGDDRVAQPPHFGGYPLPVSRPQLCRSIGAVSLRWTGPNPSLLVEGGRRQAVAGLAVRHAAWSGVHGRRPGRAVRKRIGRAGPASGLSRGFGFATVSVWQACLWMA